jgi:hypothetical protein
MSMTLRAYLFRTFAFAGAALGLLILFGLALDPFGVFGTRIVPERIFPHNQNFRSGADRVRKSLELAGRKAPIDLLLVGSSRTFLGFNPASPLLKPLHVYNGGLGAGGLEEAAGVVQFALTYHPEIQRVIWGLDSDRFLAGGTDNPEVSDSPFTGMPLATARLRQLLAVEPVGILLRAAGRMIIGRLKPDVQNDGRDITEARDHGAAARSLTFASELAFYCRQTRLPGPAGSPPLPTGTLPAGSPPLSAGSPPLPAGSLPLLDLTPLTQTLAMLKARGVDVDVIIYPLHLRLVEAQFRAGRGFDSIDGFKKRVFAALQTTAALPGPGRIRLVDFNRVNLLTGEAVSMAGSTIDMTYYYEASHFKPAFGDAIVAELLALPKTLGPLGVVLDADNFSSELAQTRQAFLDWRSMHAEDLEAVQKAGCP